MSALTCWALDFSPFILLTFQASTDESYVLRVEEERLVVIDALTYYGIRHAMETLFQLMKYDDIRKTFIINANFTIEDKPQFPYRGLMMDSARNFMPVDVVKNVIQGMAFSKVF